jgi:hypothetical protein
MDKLLDPSFWETSWKTFSSAPEIAIPLLILIGGVVWWIRGVVNGVKGQIFKGGRLVVECKYRALRATMKRGRRR